MLIINELIARKQLSIGTEELITIWIRGRRRCCCF